jgi:hypothetical protein
MTPRAAEQNRSFGRMFLHRGPETVHALAASHSPFKFIEFKAAISPRDLPKIHRILDADIVERDERFLCDSVTNRRVMRKVIIEDGRDVDPVRTFGRSCEAQNERCLNFGEHSSVAWGVRVVNLVDDDVVELLFRQSLESFRARQFLDRSND